MTQFINVTRLRVVTNCLLVFDLSKEKENFELYLIGGEYRNKTGEFVGTLVIVVLNKTNIKKAFIDINAIQDNHGFTFSIEEGHLQNLVLDKATERYLLTDAQKFNEIDFYNFYKLDNVDALFTNQRLEKEFEKYTKIIN